MRISAFIIIFICLSNYVLTQPITAFSQGSKAEVKAQVGEFTFSFSGFASKNAAVFLVSNSLTTTSTFADTKGKFRFSEIPINRGFSSFCLRQIDYRSLGESLSCMTIEPANKNVVINNIYLAPTIGLERQSITEGSSGLAYGYSMPKSKITMIISNGEEFEETADSDGYYSFTVGNLTPGSYSLQSEGLYQERQSLKPEQGIMLRVLTSSAATTNEGSLLRVQLRSWWPIILLSALAIGLGVLFFLYKRYPKLFTSLLPGNKIAAFKKRLDKRLHHAWFVGY